MSQDDVVIGPRSWDLTHVVHMTQPRSYDPIPEHTHSFWQRLVLIDKVCAQLLPHHFHKHHKTMGTSSPQRRLTVAEMYFDTELHSSLGDMVAEHWLSGTSSSCTGCPWYLPEIPLSSSYYRRVSREDLTRPPTTPLHISNALT
jgi:hypothetical protein